MLAFANCKENFIFYSHIVFGKDLQYEKRRMLYVRLVQKAEAPQRAFERPLLGNIVAWAGNSTATGCVRYFRRALLGYCWLFYFHFLFDLPGDVFPAGKDSFLV